MGLTSLFFGPAAQPSYFFSTTQLTFFPTKEKKRAANYQKK